MDFRIELGVRDEAAGIIQSRMQVGLHLAAAGALGVGAEEHVGLPDLVAVFDLELLVRRWSEQLLSERPRCLRKRYSVEADIAGSF